LTLGPAHAQIATNQTAYILLKLIKDGKIGGNEALLNFAYDLIELASEQGMLHPKFAMAWNLRPKSNFS
jgi:hypothetical protein